MEGRLESAAEYRLGEAIRLRFELYNNSNQDLYVLRWFTPLEGLRSDCLEITRDGIPIPYDGQLAKRGDPTADDYMLIRAGQRVSVEFDLSEDYEVSAPGNYHAALDTSIEMLPSVAPHDNTDAQFYAFRQEFKEQEQLPGAETSFRVVPGEEPRKTKAQVVREEERLGKLRDEFDALADVAKEPTITGGSSSEQSIARAAHHAGFSLIQGALTRLRNDADYVEWFGAYTEARVSRVRGNYGTIRDAMKSDVFTYNLTDRNPGLYGYTYKYTRTVWLCGKFWTAPNTGQDSKPGVIVHENGHAAAGLDDVKIGGIKYYGPTLCRELARDNPDKAITNADNHEYYAEGL